VYFVSSSRLVLSAFVSAFWQQARSGFLSGGYAAFAKRPSDVGFVSNTSAEAHAVRPVSAAIISAATDTAAGGAL
jgi:hypothetical protein